MSDSEERAKWLAEVTARWATFARLQVMSPVYFTSASLALAYAECALADVTALMAELERVKDETRRLIQERMTVADQLAKENAAIDPEFVAHHQGRIDMGHAILTDLEEL